MAAPPGGIDPTKPTKYPIILSDALLGKASKESFTGIRYNHRPTLSSDAAPASARLKRSARDGSYNLGFDDKGGRYQYNGARTSEDGNYILIFDPARKAFVLHRVDSMFHMNITKTPDSNIETLRKKFPQLEVKTGESSSKQQQKGKDTTTAEKAGSSKPTLPSKPKSKETKATPLRENPLIARGKKAANKLPEKPKVTELTLPTVRKAPASAPPALPAAKPAPPPEPEKSKRRNRSPIESEDEDDDIDIGLTIEYPDGNPGSFRPSFPPVSNFSPAFPTRRFSEFVRSTRDEDEEDADAEYIGGEEEEEVEFEDVPQPTANKTYRPPSPDRPGLIEPPARFEFESGEAEAGMEVDVGDDLEAELEKEFLAAHIEAEAQGHDSDSSMSEEE